MSFPCHRLVILPKDFTVVRGELGPTSKPQKVMGHEMYHDDIDRMHEEGTPLRNHRQS